MKCRFCWHRLGKDIDRGDGHVHLRPLCRSPTTDEAAQRPSAPRRHVPNSASLSHHRLGTKPTPSSTRTRRSRCYRSPATRCCPPPLADYVAKRLCAQHQGASACSSAPTAAWMIEELDSHLMRHDGPAEIRDRCHEAKVCSNSPTQPEGETRRTLLHCPRPGSPCDPSAPDGLSPTSPAPTESSARLWSMIVQFVVGSPRAPRPPARASTSRQIASACSAELVSLTSMAADQPGTP